MHSLRSHVGRRSRSHDLLSDSRTMDSTKTVLTQILNCTPLNELLECLYVGARSLSNFESNVTKKELKRIILMKCEMAM